MNKRQVPIGRSWLRRYLRDRLKLTVPFDTDDDAWQKICEGIPAVEWVGVTNAWRQHKNNDTPRYTRYVDATNEQSKRLGLFWQRLIAQDFITEEDALSLAENFFQGSGGYSDDKAKEMVKKILSEAAEQYTSETAKATDNPNKN